MIFNDIWPNYEHLSLLVFRNSFHSLHNLRVQKFENQCFLKKKFFGCIFIKLKCRYLRIDLAN